MALQTAKETTQSKSGQIQGFCSSFEAGVDRTNAETRVPIKNKESNTARKRETAGAARSQVYQATFV